MADPVSDTMGDRLEFAIARECMARSEWDDIIGVYRGDPSLLPVRLHPYAVVFLTVEGEAQGEEGYNADTGPVRYLRYDGFVQVTTLVPDARSLVPGVGDDRLITVPSYENAKRFIQAAKQALQQWAGVGRDWNDGVPVTSHDGKEVTSELRTDEIRNGQVVRPDENVENVSIFNFHIFTRRDETVTEDRMVFSSDAAVGHAA